MTNIQRRVYRSVKRRKPEVFVRADFNDMANPRQVSRALKGLVDDGYLMRIGYGLYAKATRSSLAPGTPVPRVGIRRLGEEAMRRLDISTSASAAERAYQNGETNQIPSGRVLAVNKRVRRKIGYNGAWLQFERAANS